MCGPAIPLVAAAVGTAIAGKAIIKELTPKLPAPVEQKVTEAPRSTDPLVQEARTREKEKARAASSQTLLTGGGGLTTKATTAPKTLLGQ